MCLISEKKGSHRYTKASLFIVMLFVLYKIVINGGEIIIRYIYMVEDGRRAGRLAWLVTRPLSPSAPPVLLQTAEKMAPTLGYWNIRGVSWLCLMFYSIEVVYLD